MSYSIDVNVLLYASSAGSPHHAAARAFLDRCRTDETVCCLAWPTIMAYLRTVTHAAILNPPLSPAKAAHNVAELLAWPHVRTIGEAEGFWEAWVDAAAPLSPRGKLVADVHLAVLLRHHGVSTLYTNDRDFLKFPFLRVVNPLE